MELRSHSDSEFGRIAILARGILSQSDVRVVMTTLRPCGRTTDYIDIGGHLFRCMGDISNPAISPSSGVMVDGKIYRPSGGPAWHPSYTPLPHLELWDEIGRAQSRRTGFPVHDLNLALMEVSRGEQELYNDARDPWGSPRLTGIPRGLIIADFSPHQHGDLSFLKMAIWAEDSLAYIMSWSPGSIPSGVDDIIDSLRAATFPDGSLNYSAISEAYEITRKICGEAVSGIEVEADDAPPSPGMRV